MSATSLKTCFVIAPIGAEGSETRIRSDQVLKHIITPAARECGYDPIRADQISEPGLITSQVIQHIVDDPLVIADLTDRNPNVFYELALRHTLKRPVVQIIKASETIPFDVAASRTIQFDHHDLDSVARAKEEISKQIHAVEENPADVDTPISVAIDLQSLRQSDNPIEKSNAEIITMLQDFRQEFRTTILETRSRPPGLNPRIIEELAAVFDRNTMLTEFELDKAPPEMLLHELRRNAARTERVLMMLCEEAGVSPAMILRRRPRAREAIPTAKE